MQRFGASHRQACAVLRISRSVYGYRSRARDARPLIQRIKEIAATRVHYGYRRVHVLLRREGWRENCNRVYRLYRAEGLSLRHARPRRNKSARLRQPKRLVQTINEICSMDFVADALFDGRRLRALTVVDNYTCECLAIAVGQSLKGEDVVSMLLRILWLFARSRRRSRSTMAVSSFRRRWIVGPTSTTLNSTSRVQGSRPTTRRLNPSTAVSVPNA